MSNIDYKIRRAAFAHVRKLQQFYGDAIPWQEIAKGVDVNGQNILLANRARGIFKPRQMPQSVLSIKTVFPRANRENIYNDSYINAEDFYRYALQAGSPNEGSNIFLAQAKEAADPIIYFYGVAPSFYAAILPVFIEDFFQENGSWYCRAVVGEVPVFGQENQGEYFYQVPKNFEKRYLVRESKLRLHQASFREAILSAYSNRCAVTGLPVKALLEAAHIIPDVHEGGAASVTNGIALNRIHHRAYDSNLIGITPDYRVAISERVMSLSDGPVLESGIKAFHNKKIALPSDKNNWPDKDALSYRYEEFRLDNGF